MQHTKTTSLTSPSCMKLSDETLYETGRASIDIAKLSAVALVVTPLVQQIDVPHFAQIGLAVAALFFWFAGRTMLDAYAKRKAKQGKAFTPGKRKRMRFAKNTTFDIEEQN